MERWLTIVPLRLRSLFKRGAVEAELDEELQYHLEQQTAENIRAGMTPAAARRAALRAFGGVDFQKEQVRDTRGVRWLEEFLGDLGFALRNIRRAPGFTLAVVLTLGLGIGANTAMFTLLRGTLLRPLPHRDGERLVYLRQTADAVGPSNLSFSVPELADLRASARTLGQIAEYSNVLPFTMIGRAGTPVRVRAGIVSGNFFDVMGLGPVLGRVFNASDEGAAAPAVMVLSHDYWLSQLGGDSSVIGSTVLFNERSTTIVGVAQRAPAYPERTEVFVNIVTSPHHLSATMVTERSHRMTDVFARLAPNVTVEEAEREIDSIAARMFREHPQAYPATDRHAITVTPLRDAVNERAATMFWLLMGAAAFVLLIACANVSNLTLMRGVQRERELLVRAALGASRGRLRLLLLAENVVLALLGGGLGILLALAGSRLLVAFAGQLSPRAYEIRVDGVVLLVGFLTSVLVALALSFMPRLAGQRALAASLAPSGTRATLSGGRRRLQQSLVVVQLAVCVVLLTGAGLLARTLLALSAVDTGLRAEHVLTVNMPLAGDLEREFMKQPQNLARFQRIRERVQSLPGVLSAGLGMAAPLRSAGFDLDVKAEGRPVAPNRPNPHADLRTADPGYFDAAGIPLIAGRTFNETDVRGNARVVILNQSFARELFGGENPIGRRVAWTGEVLKFSPVSGDWRTVVGVVGDTRDEGLDRAPSATMYHPFAQEFIIGAALVVRTDRDPEVLQPAIIKTIREAEPLQLVERVASIEQIRAESVAPRRLNALFIASFAGLAVLIAMVGIAGVLAFSVNTRIPEIGIRMSIGADAPRIRQMVLGEGAVLLGAGLVLGLLGALFATRLMRGLLFGVQPHDPGTLIGVAFALCAVGIAACWLPAARAARVDPAIALRAE